MQLPAIDEARALLRTLAEPNEAALVKADAALAEAKCLGTWGEGVTEVATALAVLHQLERLHELDVPYLEDAVWVAITHAEDAVKDWLEKKHKVIFGSDTMMPTALDEGSGG